MELTRVAPNAEPGARRVLAPLQGAASDPAVAVVAAAMASQMAAELVLMRLVRPPLPPLFVGLRANSGSIAADVATIGQTTRSVRAADAELRQLASTISGVATSQVILITLSPGRRVVEWLQAHSAALVVAPQREGAPIRLFGRRDLTESIVRSGLAPVLTVNCPEAPTRPAPRTTRRRRRARRLRCEWAPSRTRFL